MPQLNYNRTLIESTIFLPKSLYKQGLCFCKQVSGQFATTQEKKSEHFGSPFISGSQWRASGFSIYQYLAYSQNSCLLVNMEFTVCWLRPTMGSQVYKHKGQPSPGFDRGTGDLNQLELLGTGSLPRPWQLFQSLTQSLSMSDTVVQ